MNNKSQLTSEQISAKRNASLHGFDHANGFITSPGKFEREPLFVPYYWAVALEGFADEDTGSEYRFKFKAGDEDFEIWPELKTWLGRKRTLILRESEQGFVSAH